MPNIQEYCYLQNLLTEALKDAIALNTFCGDPEDRIYHAKDKTWWKRVGNQWVSAEPPEGWEKK